METLIVYIILSPIMVLLLIMAERRNNEQIIKD